MRLKNNLFFFVNEKKKKKIIRTQSKKWKEKNYEIIRASEWSELFAE